MDSLIIYLIKVSAGTVTLYLFYLVFFHGFVSYQKQDSLRWYCYFLFLFQSSWAHLTFWLTLSLPQLQVSLAIS